MQLDVRPSDAKKFVTDIVGNKPGVASLPQFNFRSQLPCQNQIRSLETLKIVPFENTTFQENMAIKFRIQAPDSACIDLNRLFVVVVVVVFFLY